MTRFLLPFLMAMFLASPALAATVWPIGGSDGDRIRTLTIGQNALVNDITTPMLGCNLMSATMTYLGSGAQVTMYATDVDTTPTFAEIEADLFLDQFDVNDSTHLAFSPHKQEIRFVVDTVSTDGVTVIEVECFDFSGAAELRDYGSAIQSQSFRDLIHHTDIMVKDPVTADIWGVFKAPADLTIVEIHCIVEGTSAVMSVVEGTATSMSGAGVDGATTILCDTDGQADDGTLSNPSIDEGDWVSLLLGAETATQIVVSIWYTVD